MKVFMFYEDNTEQNDIVEGDSWENIMKQVVGIPTCLTVLEEVSGD